MVATGLAVVQSGLAGNPAKGTQTNPVPVGQYAAIGSGWRMKVISIRPNVSPKAAGYGTTEPAGTGTYVVKLTLKLVGHGTANVWRVLGRMALVDAQNLRYADAAACLGNWKSTNGWVVVSSDHATAGDVCFQDRASEAQTMRLYVVPEWDGWSVSLKPLAWFALR